MKTIAGQVEAPFHYKRPPTVVRLRVLRDGAELAVVESGVAADDAEAIACFRPGWQRVWIRIRGQASILRNAMQLESLLKAAKQVQKVEAKQLAKAKAG